MAFFGDKSIFSTTSKSNNKRHGKILLHDAGDCEIFPSYCAKEFGDNEVMSWYGVLQGCVERHISSCCGSLSYLCVGKLLVLALLACANSHTYTHRAIRINEFGAPEVMRVQVCLMSACGSGMRCVMTVHFAVRRGDSTCRSEAGED